MRINWVNKGPTLTDEMVHRFEMETGHRVPEDAVWFMKNVVNGGDPEKEQWLPLDEDDDWPGSVNTIYGIHHPTDHANLRLGLQVLSEVDDHSVWPLGYDGSFGQYVLQLKGPEAGEVWLLPTEHWIDPEFEEGYFVSPDIKAFARLVEEQREPKELWPRLSK